MTTQRRAYVGSEVGQLRRVLLHRPDRELARLTPSNKDVLLFDDLPWVEEAQKEHDDFARALRELDVEVLYLQDVLTETLEHPAARQFLFDHLLDDEVFGPQAIDAMLQVLSTLGSAELASVLIGGITKEEMLGRMPYEPASLVLNSMAPTDFMLAPLPNHLFTRDTTCWVYGGISINSMRMTARVRESLHYEAIYHWHPELSGGDHSLTRWSDGLGTGLATMEGGDVHVLGRGGVLVGMSERTTPQAVERLAQQLFAAHAATSVVAVAMPKERAMMHLDTVMSMVDEETFTKYAGLGMLPSYTLRPGDEPGRLQVQAHPPEEMHRAIARSIGLDDIRTLTADQDLAAAEREQWDDGCNVLTVRPGVVIAYERNITSNNYLRDNGVEVVTIKGSELGRGRGGPRCMSCPIEREGI
ncbi:arginine deiminase [Arsenicicoccus sp. oral taxon 190]|uniref:arginine deiminase n=1 Tax=Arsenicicoccus sp. oral taxon 190 TaxID=1658671 RepID=UPI000679FC4C|nr:arginine deiminase [Arsenicicoccus sp. oral taxon 190]AKT50709.1 arginine deiminase [Arsenicicoccus sp. oral taxon 190]